MTSRQTNLDKSINSYDPIELNGYRIAVAPCLLFTLKCIDLFAPKGTLTLQMASYPLHTCTCS